MVLVSGCPVTPGKRVLYFSELDGNILGAQKPISEGLATPIVVRTVGIHLHNLALPWFPLAVFRRSLSAQVFLGFLVLPAAS